VPSYNELKTPIFTIPAGSHYVVATVDRTLGRATVYVDGQSRGSVNLPAGQAFITPAGGYDHARFAFFSREDDTTLGTYTPAPTGYGVDAARVMKRALSLQEIRTNHDLIRAGIAVPPTEVAVEICDSGADDDGDGLVDCDDPDCAEFAACLLARFVRGDADGSGGINLTDGVNILLWSFQGGVEPACLDAADTDDTGSINLSDPIRIFQWLFLGGVAPVDPMPSGAAYVIGDCGSDPTGDDPFDCGTPGPVCAPAL
jgi:hypothetical protein